MADSGARAGVELQRPARRRRPYHQHDDADRTALHAALADSEQDVAAGRLIDAADVLKELRSH